ncbi:hypothetical protein [Vibrio neptunius]|uniref:hypothetical protein n=1 Tax=Vibrio neptunius TaxID=170651 RepID=UPI001C5C87F7|nr:hypothetical protein [Vibrio neptunius]QXX09031.1 hypothetical protein KW548_18210 [Vibrio neptunius]
MKRFLLLKQIHILSLFFISFWVSAQNYDSMGCRWNIPDDIEKLDRNIYSSLTHNILIEFENMTDSKLESNYDNAEIVEELVNSSFHYQRLTGLDKFSEITIFYLVRHNYEGEMLSISSHGSSVEMKELNENRVVIELAVDGSIVQASCNGSPSE